MKKFPIILALLCMLAAGACNKAFAGDETKYRTALVMAYSPANSVYEDDNIKLEIYDERLWATNKTNKAIFIDLSQCFLVHNGSSYPMYEKQQNEKHASKVKKSSSDEEFISIAPATGGKQNASFICAIGASVYGKYSTTESPMSNFSEYDERMLAIINELVNESLAADPKGKEYVGTATRHLTEDESVSNIGASIAYAFNKRAEEWNSVAISTWVSDIALAPFYVELPEELSKKEKRGFGIKRTEAAQVHVKADSPFEFESDKSPIIICDWVGDFKKGEFTLGATWVKKKKKMGFGKILGATFATLLTGGIGAVLFTDYDATYYKKEINFNGQDANWGKMKYMKTPDLSQFNND